jgi:hypothetical protein
MFERLLAAGESRPRQRLIDSWRQKCEAAEEAAMAAQGSEQGRAVLKPPLLQIAEPYRRAFLELQAHRQMDFNGPQPLTMADVGWWLLINRISHPGEQQRYIDLIRIQDVEWRRLISKRAGGGSQKIGEGKEP